ncbi:MAG: hypothetical protein J6Q85_04550 [Clostridia bacterium]|nr:hypothetical protein [Clostridia bacterium]
MKLYSTSAFRYGKELILNGEGIGIIANFFVGFVAQILDLFKSGAPLLERVKASERTKMCGEFFKKRISLASK